MSLRARAFMSPTEAPVVPGRADFVFCFGVRRGDGRDRRLDDPCFPDHRGLDPALLGRRSPLGARGEEDP